MNHKLEVVDFLFESQPQSRAMNRQIAILIDSLRIGGSERQVTETALGFKRLNLGYDIHVLTFKNGKFSDVLRDEDIPVSIFTRKHRYDLSPMFRINNYITDHGIELVHTWDSLADLYTFPLKIFRRVRWMAASIQSVIGQRQWQESLQRRTWYHADLVVGNSEAGLEAFQAPEGRSAVVYNGIDITRMRSDAGRVQEVTDISKSKSYTVGMVANMTRYKDHSTALKAAALLKEKGIPIQLIFVGDGPRRAELETTVQDLGLSAIVTMVGQQVNVSEFICNFDVGLLTSSPTGEGISNAILECMTLGVPVVASSIGGTSEIIEDGVNGFLVPQGDPESAAEKLEILYNDEVLRREMSLKASATVEDRFHVDIMVRRTKQLYDSILEG